MAVNYIEINKRALDLMLSVKKHTPAINDGLKALVEIRVSQINGCAFCVDLHTTQAREMGIQQQLLDCLPVWKECGLFSDEEMAALEWAEIVTNISSVRNIEPKLKKLLKSFDETEAVDLTIVISLMNSMNRLAISFGDRPPNRSV